MAGVDFEGLLQTDAQLVDDYVTGPNTRERLAALVAAVRAEEREACAVECDRIKDANYGRDIAWGVAEGCAGAIRRRTPLQARGPSRPSMQVATAITFLLVRIGSWTAARFDQHLRNEFGDEVADAAMAWLAANVAPVLGKSSLGTPWYVHLGVTKYLSTNYPPKKG